MFIIITHTKIVPQKIVAIVTVSKILINGIAITADPKSLNISGNPITVVSL